MCAHLYNPDMPLLLKIFATYIYAACYVPITGIQRPSSCWHIYKSVIRYFRKQESHRFILWYAHCSSSCGWNKQRLCINGKYPWLTCAGTQKVRRDLITCGLWITVCDRRRGFQTPRVPGVTCAQSHGMCSTFTHVIFQQLCMLGVPTWLSWLAVVQMFRTFKMCNYAIRLRGMIVWCGFLNVSL